MSGYAIGDVPTIQMEADASEVLAGSNSIQESLMAEAVIQVTEHDEVIGPVSKLDSHHQIGKYHRAFSVLLFDKSGRLLLQKRASHKITFPNVCRLEFSYDNHNGNKRNRSLIVHGEKSFVHNRNICAKGYQGHLFFLQEHEFLVERNW